MSLRSPSNGSSAPRDQSAASRSQYPVFRKSVPLVQPGPRSMHVPSCQSTWPSGQGGSSAHPPRRSAPLHSEMARRREGTENLRIMSKSTEAALHRPACHDEMLAIPGRTAAWQAFARATREPCIVVSVEGTTVRVLKRQGVLMCHALFRGGLVGRPEHERRVGTLNFWPGAPCDVVPSVCSKVGTSARPWPNVRDC